MRNKGGLAEAVITRGIEATVVDLPSEVREGLATAQLRQMRLTTCCPWLGCE